MSTTYATTQTFSLRIEPPVTAALRVRQLLENGFTLTHTTTMSVP